VAGAPGDNRSMSNPSDSLFESALSLPQAERADLAFRLLQSVDAPSEGFDLSSVIDNVRKITQELFPGKCEFTHEFDPEYPDDRYVVVNVEARGEPKELVDRSCEWSERIRRLPGYVFGKLRLSIMPI
jgi:hypothetical protein